MIPAMVVVALVLGVAAKDPSSVDPDLIALARQTVVAQVRHLPMPVVDRRDRPSPVFVTIEHQGKVLGCRGDLRVRFGSLQDEVLNAARAAAGHDPRYRPLGEADIKSFLVTVTLVHRQEPVTDIAGLFPGDGLVLVSGGHQGIVLPYEGKDPKVRLEWAYRKAGVTRGAPVRLFRLIADRDRG